MEFHEASLTHLAESPRSQPADTSRRLIKSADLGVQYYAPTPADTRDSVRGDDDDYDPNSGLAVDRDCRGCGRCGTAEDSAGDSAGAHRRRSGARPRAADRATRP